MSLTIDQAMHYAVQRHQAGQIAEAEGIYRQVLTVDPNHADAMHLLGRVTLDTGRLAEAMPLLTKAVALCPNEALYQNALGLALKTAGQLAPAVEGFQRAIALRPDLVDPHLNLGNILAGQGDIAGAIACCRAALAIDSNSQQAHNNLAVALHMMGRTDEAIVAFREVVRLQPRYADAQFNLGALLLSRGEAGPAASALHAALSLGGNFPGLRGLLGSALAKLGQLAEAEAFLRETLRQLPDDATTHLELGIVLLRREDFALAVESFRAAIRRQPDLSAAHRNLALALLAADRIDESADAYRAALVLEPQSAWLHANLASMLLPMADLDGALTHLRQALALTPTDPLLHSNLCFAMQFHSASTPEIIREECANWNCRHAEPLRCFIVPHGHERAPARRLRIGYVSPHFWNHVVGRNVLPLLEGHDRECFEIVCYSDTQRPDEMTGRFRLGSDRWRDTFGVPDEELDRMIRADEIDILVDLTLHMSNNRLPVFARKPAPVQVTFAGYPGTTGVEAIDYRLTDPWLDPPGVTDRFYSEESIRLPHSFWCYQPFAEVAVNKLPAASRGTVTFGCLNNACKITEPVLALWSRVMRVMPGSKLLLLVPPGPGRGRFRESLGRHGIDPARVEFLAKMPRIEYLEAYHRIDLMLDTSPYNGHTTSLDALWMGVPVVSLAGQYAASRAGLSQLTNLGLAELVAHTEDEFTAIAVGLAMDLSRLAELRRGLRARMESSALMDVPGFVTGIEAAYRSIWRRWCGAAM